MGCVRRSAAFAFICASFAFPGANAQGLAIVDDAGRKVELKAPAQRIVTLAPFLTELAYSAGAGGKLVGASAHSDYPAEAKKLPQVASAAGPDIESLAALAPDLVLAWQDSIRPAEVERIGKLGIAVFVARAKRLDDPPRLAEAIARLAGTDASAGIRAYRERLQLAVSAHAARTRIRLFVEVWHRPLTTIGGTHWINEALGACGAENVFADLGAVAPVVSWEELYRRDPRAVLVAGPAAGEAESRANWRERASIPAIKARRFAYIDADTLTRPTLRLAEGVERVCAAVEKFR